MTRSSIAVLALDVAVVVTFVLFGRETHESPFDVAESLRVAAPFMAGLGLAWLLPPTRRSAWRILTGVLVGAVTAFIGIALRSLVFNDGISGAFPIVTMAYMVGLMSLYRFAMAMKSRSAP